MLNSEQELESLWDDLLSGQADHVLATFNRLKPMEQQSVILHLNRMVKEAGWLPMQSESAQAALRIIADDRGEDIGVPGQAS